MKNELKFYKCTHCGNLITMVEPSGVPVVCCNEKMGEIKANTTDAATEKHVPVVSVNGSTVEVEVGSVAHPMTEEHHIAWIVIETKQGFEIKYLDHLGAPKATFILADGDKLTAVYEYCNLHGLWKKEA